MVLLPPLLVPDSHSMATVTNNTHVDDDQQKNQQSISSSAASLLFPHLVIPGQIIAVSTATEDSFLRGHGTYLQKEEDKQGTGSKIQLRASVTGTVVRVNQLISIEAVALHTYAAQVGDLVVGRIAAIGNARWNVALDDQGCFTAALPLSGVHLPGSVQRVRTAADALEMRQHLQEGDLVSAEVHKTRQWWWQYPAAHPQCALRQTGKRRRGDGARPARSAAQDALHDGVRRQVSDSAGLQRHDLDAAKYQQR